MMRESRKMQTTNAAAPTPASVIDGMANRSRVR